MKVEIDTNVELTEQQMDALETLLPELHYYWVYGSEAAKKRNAK